MPLERVNSTKYANDHESIQSFRLEIRRKTVLLALGFPSGERWSIADLHTVLARLSTNIDMSAKVVNAESNGIHSASLTEKLHEY